MMAAINKPEPVKDNQVKAKTAPSGVGFATIGATFMIILSRSGTAYFQVAQELTAFMKWSVPQISSTIQTMINGISDYQMSAVLGRTPGFGAAMLAADSSWVRSAAEVQIFLGCQMLRNAFSAPIEISVAPMSTIHGLMKLEIRNCGTAKDTPVTRMAGQTSFMPFQPAKAQPTQNGTIRKNTGNSRPTIAPSRNGSSPVTLDRPAIDVPTAPFTTVTVLSISDT